MAASRPSHRRPHVRPRPKTSQIDRFLEPITGESQRQVLYAHILEHLRDSQPRRVGFQRDDLIEALGSASIAVVAIVPSLVPLWLLRDDPLPAMRISDVVSFIMLFVLGYRWGTYTGSNPWKTGALLFFAGVILMAIAIPLGG